MEPINFNEPIVIDRLMDASGIRAICNMSIKIFLLLFFYFQNCCCWNFNCLFQKCKKDNTNPAPKSLTNIWYCKIFNCEQEIITEKPGWNPSCWFKDCSTNTGKKNEKSPKFWNYDYWFKKTSKKTIKSEDSQSLKDKLYCFFKDCQDEEKKEENSKIESSFQNAYASVVNYLNAAKPQEFVINNMLSSEMNPYCWFTECCNDNTLPGNVEKLSSFLKTHLYGQHLVNNIIDAIGSHWNSGLVPKKALVLSFHGPVGTGKNYVSEMIGNSLFKLGVKSKYVHSFSGRLHFTLRDNSESYTHTLYSWLKGNVTACSKQLFIFDEADHMPEQVLNSILPMLDYREKVDGVDYRSSIFVFLSNAGSQLILEKLNGLYGENITREEVKLIDFEKIIVNDIFNKRGGFYHSDTISHNLIDHYIPFLPLEKHHVKQCIMDQFKIRNVESPLEKHIRSILDSVSWGETEHLKYSEGGCKRIGSKVSTIYESYYKPSKSKTEL